VVAANLELHGSIIESLDRGIERLRARRADAVEP